ncbi:MAG: aldehyde dehydrogenase family protein [Acidobacteria bacterium]|nr:aldehyde dehydrogenase family protein [Acidobacteriota bacterium]MBV9145732.1 aldehyde dehydrogenase family protein [Acidobacteriota bacterium]
MAIPSIDDVTRSGFLLAGEWIQAGEKVEVRSPFDDSLVGKTWNAERQHVERAIAAAVSSCAELRQLAAYQRKDILLKVAAAIREHAATFIRLMALEAGKPFKPAKAEVDRAVLTFTTAAEESVRIEGEYLPLDFIPGTEKRWGIVKRFPIGPIAAITPFNFPLNLVAHKLAPAMAVGCPVVLKPAPQTPFCALLLARLILESAWPRAALSVLPLKNDDAGQLVTDERIKLLSFTGSAAVGWELKGKAGKKKVVLELGGNAAVIVHEDAHLDVAVPRCVAGAFGYAGQSCISVQRILVHANIFDQFTARMMQGAGQLRVGDPLDENIDVGPLIRASDAQRVEDWIAEAVRGGAKLLCGGKARGTLFEPTLLSGTKPEMKVNCEEIFASVATIEPYYDFDDALQQINQSRFGLQSGLFTRNAELIFRAFDRLEVGGVIVSDVPTFRVDPMPYGGVKDSGLGREGIRYSMEEMTERKLLVMPGF